MFETLGFSPFFEEAFLPFAAEGLIPGRVLFASREIARVLTPGGERLARLAGRLRHAEGTLPVTGDWVAVRPTSPGDGVLKALLPRRGALARREPGRRAARQVLAANVDVALLVQSASGLNARSLERYAALAWDGGALPVVVLAKCDLVADVSAARDVVEGIAPGVAVHPVSAISGEGLAALTALLAPGTTAALLGPSGAGKSTLANTLAGATLLATGAVRASDARGRHTTSAREMVPLPWGAWLLDTPGLRELGLATDEPRGFDAIDALAASCRFRDCQHDAEPGCAVLSAVRSGSLDEGRLAGFRKLRREAVWIAEREESTPAAVEKRRWKKVVRAARLAPSPKR